MMQVPPDHKDMGKRVRNIPALVDLDERFRVMDQFDDYAQVICLASPPIEALGGPDVTPNLDRPIWLHPARGANFPDYHTEETSQYEIWFVFGWPYETSVVMARLVFGAYFDRFPNLKIITHHMGGMVPYFEGRVGTSLEQLGTRTSDEDYTGILRQLKRPHLDYFKMFYADTALFGATAAATCGLEFFGVDQVLFASDSPFDPEKGPRYIRETIQIIDALPISNDDRQKIYAGSARKLLKL